MKFRTALCVAVFSIYLISAGSLLPVARANPTVDHSIYSELLKKYVEDGKVNYTGFKAEETKLDDLGLSVETARFISDLDRWQREKDAQLRTVAMTAVVATLGKAKTRQDLEDARQQVNDVIDAEHLAEDSEANRMLAEIRSEIERYDTTEAEMGIALRRLRSGGFDRARDTLDGIDTPSRLLRNELTEGGTRGG